MRIDKVKIRNKKTGVIRKVNAIDYAADMMNRGWEIITGEVHDGSKIEVKDPEPTSVTEVHAPVVEAHKEKTEGENITEDKKTEGSKTEEEKYPPLSASKKKSRRSH